MMMRNMLAGNTPLEAWRMTKPKIIAVIKLDWRIFPLYCLQSSAEARAGALYSSCLLSVEWLHLLCDCCCCATQETARGDQQHDSTSAGHMSVGMFACC